MKFKKLTWEMDENKNFVSKNIITKNETICFKIERCQYVMQYRLLDYQNCIALYFVSKEKAMEEAQKLFEEYCEQIILNICEQ